MIVTMMLAATMFVECENFEKLGGWTVETQSMRQLGSSYVMAHGYGQPVADAETKVDFPAAGEYVIWARTRNWNAEWAKGAAGRFRVEVLPRSEASHAPFLSEVLGADADGKWHWQKAGTVRVAEPAKRNTVRLHDLTGFNGRCDALYFTTEGDCPPADGAELEAWRHAKTGVKVVDCEKKYDLIVVGGGMAGTCAAIAANRYGMNVLLLQDRDMLGGCNSSEVRVAMGGTLGLGPYPAIGKVVRDIQPYYGDGDPHDAKYYEDGRKEVPFTMAKDRKRYWNCPYPEADLAYRQYVYAVEMVSNRIAAVLARNTHTGAETRYCAPLFVDATGDAVLARLAGCRVMYGREERERWHEVSAPEKSDRQVMGHSIQWLTKEEPSEQRFPDISDWALPIDDTTGYYVTKGSWEQETGQYRDMADETETIRDYGLLAIFSNWNWLKNKSPRRAEFANRRFDWISPIGGKRESYRVVGDYVLTQVDMENDVTHEDDTAAITWNIDLHFPDPENAAKFKEPFRSAAYHRGTGNTPPVPYRCLYARDCANLFLAGRHISCSHVAFAAVRVMRTLGQLGEVVGMAAKICTDAKCLPRDVYTTHLATLKEMMKSGVPDNPVFHDGGNFIEDAFDFNRRGWVSLYPHGEEHELTPTEIEQIRSQGFVLRNAHRSLHDARRKLVLADESRAFLHYYDSAYPSQGFKVELKKPLWDLKRVGETTFRTVCHGGYQVTDLKTRKVVEEFQYPGFEPWMATACCDLPGGGFVFSVNPQDEDSGKAIHFYEFGADRQLRCIHKLPGYFNARSMAPGRNGEWLVAHEKGFARIRIPKDGDTVEVVKNYPQPSGRNLFAVVPTREGDGYLAGCGYGGGLVRFDGEGKVVSQWFVPTDTGKESRFYAQAEERENGDIYLAHWTGHGENDSFKGVQVVEFDSAGKPIWTLDSPDRFGSISGIIVLEEERQAK